ncbi:MAG: hypothetical protein AAGI48_03120 [Verrucomicrobiota bacterium]
MKIGGYLFIPVLGGLIGAAAIPAPAQSEKENKNGAKQTDRQRIHYSFVVKRAPDDMDPDEVDADWKIKPHHPAVEEWKTHPASETTWRLSTWHQASGSKANPSFDISEGQTSVRFGGKTKLLLQKQTSKGGRFVDETMVECSMDQEWIIDPQTGEITSPPGPSLDDDNTARKGISRARLKAGIGYLHGFVSAGFQEKNGRGEWQRHQLERDTAFYWEVYKRKTIETLNKNGKVVGTEREDTLVSLSDSDIRSLERGPGESQDR